MALGIATTIRNDRLNNLKTKIDAGGAGGWLRIYDGARPATGGTATNILAELQFSYPCAPAPANGTLTFSSITADASANATGTATWCRITDSTGAFVADASVGTSSADFILNSASITAGIQVSCSSAVINEGNP